MKITTPEESVLILARLCSQRFDSAAIKYYLEASPTARDFRNRFVAAFFVAYCGVLASTLARSRQPETKTLAEDFDAARESLDTLKGELDAWLNITERWGEAVDGFAWKTQKPPPRTARC